MPKGDHKNPRKNGTNRGVRLPKMAQLAAKSKKLKARLSKKHPKKSIEVYLNSIYSSSNPSTSSSSSDRDKRGGSRSVLTAVRHLLFVLLIILTIKRIANMLQVILLILSASIAPTSILYQSQ